VNILISFAELAKKWKLQSNFPILGPLSVTPSQVINAFISANAGSRAQEGWGRGGINFF